MHLHDIVTWARDLGLETEYDEQAHRYRFRGTPEMLRFGEPGIEVDSDWMTHFEAEEFLQGLETDLQTQAE
jgi:hypothetical protein